ncbi:hypothetical protein DDF62_02530 [Caulobacter radicis]|uniref:hypothetical protein n=1 Tax=Caulobacter radicis TaxID=2172650 RepID=UPI000D577741|nr:hypothetical protein [Caulobacter radicis]PVM92050.1 hypothetical protein DDF62_02530 [Caulobacter radicis]
MGAYEPYKEWTWRWWGVWWPWAEVNQGLLSAVGVALSGAAIFLTISLFLHEQRRANDAELARRTEQARAEAAEQTARDADLRAEAKAAEAFRIRQLREFGRLIEELLIETEEALASDLQHIDRQLANTPIMFWELSSDVDRTVRDVDGALTVLAPSFPRDASLILRIQRVRRAVGAILGKPFGDIAQGNNWVKDARDDLLRGRAEIAERLRDLEGPQAPPPPT